MKKSKLSYFLLIMLLVTVTALASFALVACNKQESEPPKTGPEAGVYYYDAGADEYTVVLGEGCQFTLAIADTARAGSYSLNGEVLTLTSNKAEEGQISAILKDNVIVLTLNDAEYRFLKKINYTVSFNSNEGSSVNSVTVVNGKKVAKPADPTREGYIFVGWYEDAEFGKAFSFNSHIITADTTVFARWVAKQVGGVEYTVEFDAHNGGNNPEAMQTTGGKLFNLPVAERNGYTFKGWWVSMSGDDRLSYEFNDGMSLDSDTTLHAVWLSDNLGAKLAEPLVNVDANSIKWDSVGAREYQLTVQGPSGNLIVNKRIGGTVEPFAFANQPEGDYIITVTAVATTGEANNSVTTRLYRNNGLARVSNFSVIEPSMLLFGAVKNAEKYLITVDCGDKNHNHVDFDNGSSMHFNFADCMMQNSGIKFTVKAVANGFVTSQSKEFVYAPKLESVTEFDFDEQTQKLVWNEVDNATGYMVSVKSGNSPAEFVNVGKINSISLKEYGKGEITVKVYPVSKLYISPEAGTFKFNKQNIATPNNIRIKGTVVSWDAVDGASSYEVRIAGTTVSTTDATASIDLAGKVALTEKANYTLTVVAKGATNSLATDPIDARNLAMADSLKYENSMLSWTHVIGAGFYDVQVNNEPIFSVSDGSNFAKINLTQAGMNTLKVRFVGVTGTAFEWVSVNVYAHTVTFVSDGGSSIDEQYKAVGDEIVLPTPQKNGYDFLDWYNTPKGPESNGSAYKDTMFNESGDIVLYACYTPKAYTVTYHYGDGGNGSQTSAKVYYQKDYQLFVPQANDSTSSFGGWFSAPNGNGIQYTDENGNSLNPWNRTENADVYAFWYDDVLIFTLTSNAGRPIYAVMQGSRISQVTEVTVPDTYKGVKVGMLSGNAFKDCSNLVTLNIPDTVEIISAVDPFTGCTSLSAINVYKVEGNNSVRYWSSDGVLFDNGRLDQPSSAKISYMPLGKTGSYTIPDGITEIPTLAFANCALSRVVIPASVARIGVEAFKDSKSLAEVVFDAGSAQALTIADGAFANCEVLTSITLPACLTSIALDKYELLRASGSPASQEVSLSTGITNAFAGCKTLTAIHIASGSKNYKSVDGILYSANGATLLYCLPSVDGDLEIPNGVTTIANGAFIGCNSIDNVTIPNTVTKVGECAFYDTDLESVTFKGNGFSEVTIGKYAFRKCTSLESVVFESGNRVSYIEEGAFFGCDDLSAMELPLNLKSVGAQAFRDCTYLKSVEINSTSASLTFGTDVFYNCSRLTTLSLPKNVSKLPGIFSGCTSLSEVKVDPDNPYFTSDEGVLFDKDKTIILFYPSNKSDTSYTLPETVATISDGVFRGNSKLTTITIGKNVTKIGNDAFRDCRYLASVIFEDDGTAPLEIGAYAFYEAGSSVYSSISIALPDRTKKVGEYAFAEIGYLSSFTLNEGLEEISDGMFYNAKRLTEANIPASVTRIGESAFYNCGYMPDKFVVTFAENSKLESIEEKAFNRTWSTASDKRSVELPDGLQYIGYQAFYDSQFVEITIPNTVKIIEAEAFASNSYLQTVTFVSGGTDDLILGAQYVDNSGNVSEGQVFRRSKIQSVELPERLTFIGKETFYDCSSLTSVSFGANSRLKHIGSKAFSSTALTSLEIPKSVANGDVVIDAKGTKEYRIGIGDSAFNGIHTLEVVDFASGGTAPLSLGDSVFYYMNKLTTVNLPSRIADLSERAFAYIFSNGTSDGQASESVLTDINIASGSSLYCSIDGVVYTADKSVLLICPVNKTGTVTIDSHVAKIERNAFKYAKITGIVFEGGNVDMVIEANAFYRCNSLTEVVLSDNVVEIKEGAFSRCEMLKSVTLSANLKEFNPSIFEGTNIQTINISTNSKDYASQNGIIFSKDMKTLILYPSTVEAETYTLPSGATAIADGAFANNTYLKTVVLPSGLTEIGSRAFSGCSSLTGVIIPASVEIIKENAFNQCTSLGELKFEKNGTAQLVIEQYAFQYAGTTSVELPARLTALGSYAFGYNASLASITFETGSRLDSLGDSVFYGCALLKTFAMPQGVSVIGDTVFGNCTGLVSVSFGEGLREIGNYTFSNCSSLERVEFPSSLTTMGIGTFTYGNSSYNYNCASLKSVSFALGSQLQSIPEGTFYQCTALERITIPASVTKIESPLWSDDYTRPESGHYGAFQGCTALKAITFEEGSKCKEIGNMAFYDCTALEAFTIPSSISTLGIKAFSGCTSITEIVIPSTATVYGRELFSGCKSLVNVTLNEKATALSYGMFSNCTSLKQLKIPASVTSFGESLLSNTGIETFAVPSNITELPRYFLSSCKSLVSVELPSGLRKIGEYAFGSCTALKSIEIPASVTMIADSAFRDCSLLSDISLSANLETIESYAFYACRSLTSITIPSKVNLIEYSAFRDCLKLVEVINKSSLELGRSHDSYIGYYGATILTEGQESNIKNVNGFVLYQDGEELKVLGYNGNDAEIVIPAGVTAIYPYAFSDSNIKKVTLSATITEISDYAFNNCLNLTDVVIQGQVTRIGKYAFAYCDNLSAINVPSSVTTIDEHAFDGCKSLSSIELPENLTTLGSYAFRNCESLNSIVIPDGVSRLNIQVFDGCKGLTEVTLPASLSYMASGSSFPFIRCTSLQRYIMKDGGNSDYKIVDGILYNASGTKLISMPSGKTGVFVISKEVTSFDDYAFSGSQLDMLMFESGRSSKFYASSAYSVGWLANATVKSIVLSMNEFSYINSYVFSSWTSEQTLYFVESEDVLYDKSVWYGASGVKANVVYEYQADQTA